MARLNVLSDNSEDEEFPELSVLMQRVKLKSTPNEINTRGAKGKGKELRVPSRKENRGYQTDTSENDSDDLDSDQMVWRAKKSSPGKQKSTAKQKSVKMEKTQQIQKSLKILNNENPLIEKSLWSSKKSSGLKNTPRRRQLLGEPLCGQGNRGAETTNEDKCSEVPFYPSLRSPPFRTTSQNQRSLGTQESGLSGRVEDRTGGDRAFITKDFFKHPVVPSSPRKQRPLGSVQLSSFSLPVYDSPRRLKERRREPIPDDQEFTRPRQAAEDPVDYHAFAKDLRDVLYRENDCPSGDLPLSAETPRSKFSSNAVNDSSSDSDVFIRAYRRQKDSRFTSVELGLKSPKQPRSSTKMARLQGNEQLVLPDTDSGSTMPPPRRRKASSSSSFEEPYLTSPKLANFIHEIESETSSLDDSVVGPRKKRKSQHSPPSTKLERLFLQMKEWDDEELGIQSVLQSPPTLQSENAAAPSGSQSQPAATVSYVDTVSLAIGVPRLGISTAVWVNGDKPDVQRPGSLTKPYSSKPAPKTARVSPIKKDTKPQDPKKFFHKQKYGLAINFVKEIDDKLTSGAVAIAAAHTGGIEVAWSKKLLKTAGMATCKQIKTKSIGKDGNILPAGTYFAKIELAEKIVTDFDRLHNVVAHEYCHIANFILDGVSRGHGASFKAWGRKASAAFSHLDVKVTRCHNYEIEYKYVWECVICKHQYSRHSPSIDTSRHLCGGTCRGRLVQIKPAPKEVLEGSYREFSKRRFTDMKSRKGPDGEALEFSEKVKIIGAEWKELKARPEGAMNVQLHNTTVGLSTGISKMVPIELDEDSGIDMADDDDGEETGLEANWDDEGVDD